MHDNRNVCYQQFGNSVVIDVLQQIIQEIIEIPEVMKEWQE
ncbi:MAG: DNA cytosine methyltransferase [Lachnospiraceae bacterium]|nr:DNA cytosine methyltransferase [Lachnospiraceae bacterium]